MQRLRWCVALVVLSGSVFAAAAERDPLAVYLTSKGFSNVPYTDQNRVAPGGYVAYDTQHKKAPSLWEGPVEGEVPVIMPASGEIHIPKETMNKLRTLDIDIKIFGSNPMAKLQSGSTLEYTEMILKPSALRDANAVYALLTPGSALEKEFLEYGDANSRVYKNQHLYAILTVYYSTGVTITSTKSIGLGGSTGDKIDACPTSITPPADPNAGKGGGAPAQAGADAGQAGGELGKANGAKGGAAAAQPPSGIVGIGTAAAKAAAIAAGQAVGGAAGQAVSGSGGAAAAKSSGDKAATDAVKAASGSLPGGGGRYCRVDETHVEFHSDQPIPIAAQLLQVKPYGDKWNLLGGIVQFDGAKTTEISK